MLQSKAVKFFPECGKQKFGDTVLLFSIPSYMVCKKQGLVDILPSHFCSLSLGVGICRQEENGWNGEGLKISLPVPCLCHGFQSGVSASICTTASV